MKPKKREVPKIEYYVYCPECGKEIKGFSKKQVEYNLDIHIQSHKRKDKK